MANVSKAMEYAAAFERGAMRERLDAALARTVMLDQTSHDTTPPAGDIRALKHRIHALEGELLGYKKIVADQDAMLERQTARSKT